MGLTWILALITNWQQFAFLQIPSTILNSLQGIVLNYLRQRMPKTILFQLSSMAFLSDLEESDVFFLSFFKKKTKTKNVDWRDGRPTAGRSEKEFEARVALGCASSNSYASFVLSKLPAFLLTHEPIFNCRRYKNVFFFMLLLFDRVFHHAVLYHHKESTWPHQRQTSQATHSNRTSNNHDSV